MNDNPATVSVVIPVFNGARYLPEAVASVRAQTSPASEVIIVDDGSTDDTPAVIQGLHGVVSLAQSNQGIAATRNRGVETARGDYIAFLDADDLFVTTKLERQLAHLSGGGAPDISFGCVEEFVSADLSGEEARALRPRQGALAGGVPGAMLIARRAFDRVGPFDTAWRVGEFADWYLRAVELGLRVETLPDVVLRRRLHGDNVGIRSRASRVDFARIAKRALDRRRQDSTDR